MELDKIIGKNSVLLDLEAKGAAQAISFLCAFAAKALGAEPAAVLGPVLEREALGSTAVGGGVAIPHGKTPLVESVKLFMARTAQGFELSDYDSPDGRPVRLIALLLGPERLDPDHLKVLAVLGRLWRSPENVNQMMAAKDPESFLETLLSLSGPTPAAA
ncbi:MAG: PTS sugar transporter subunit IIA [Deltaproteobacteria bacterium]|jgi:mannitol/fructose-specific phosphotransferase system IIA component (Ntr-type)|nr:PTS sugar transporter subunit IIA [Deltaproteobacteria bacterium]